MTPTSQVWKRAYENWKAAKARVWSGVVIAALTFLVRVLLSPGGWMSPEIVKGLIAAASAFLIYGAGTLLWHLWLAPFSLLEEHLHSMHLQEEVAQQRLGLGSAARTILYFAANLGEEIVSTDRVVKLNKTREWASAGQSGYPACKAAVQELLNAQLIEPTGLVGQFRVSVLGHKAISLLTGQERTAWASGVQ